MKYCFPFLLKSQDIISQFIKNYTKDMNTENIYFLKIHFPDDILDIVNTELADLGVPKISSGMAFKRKNFIDHSCHKCHIDYSPSENNSIHASVVIPIEGCEGTRMYWYGGDYFTETTQKPGTYPYMNVKWRSPGQLLEAVEISKQPMLCRTDIPHSATSNADGSY